MWVSCGDRWGFRGFLSLQVCGTIRPPDKLSESGFIDVSCRDEHIKMKRRILLMPRSLKSRSTFTCEGDLASPFAPKNTIINVASPHLVTPL